MPALEPESESDVDIYTIIFLALAVFIFLRLRSVLGQRTGSERPPYDRAAPNVVQRTQDNNVVPMPGAVIDQAPLAPTAGVAQVKPAGTEMETKPTEPGRNSENVAFVAASGPSFMIDCV